MLPKDYLAKRYVILSDNGKVWLFRDLDDARKLVANFMAHGGAACRIVEVKVDGIVAGQPVE